VPQFFDAIELSATHIYESALLLSLLSSLEPSPTLIINAHGEVLLCCIFTLIAAGLAGGFNTERSKSLTQKREMSSTQFRQTPSRSPINFDS
jgi:hypothetical protein